MCKISSASILIILSYTISKFGYFLRLSVLNCVVILFVASNSVNDVLGVNLSSTSLSSNQRIYTPSTEPGCV